MRQRKALLLLAVMVLIGAIVALKASRSSPGAENGPSAAAVTSSPAKSLSAGPPAVAMPGKPTSAATGEPSTDGLPQMLELGSHGCIPCDYMAPIIAALTEELKGKVHVEFIDVGKDPATAEKYKIMTIPTQVFLDKDGTELWRHVGTLEKDEIVAKLKELGMLKE